MYKLVNQIVNIPDLTPSESSILFWLANHANNNGIAFPGIHLLMRESRLCKRAIHNTLRRLEHKHLITKLDTPPPEARRRTAYAMTYAELFVLDPVVQAPTNGTNGHRPAPPVVVEPQLDDDDDDEWSERRPDENIREYAARIQGKQRR